MRHGDIRTLVRATAHDECDMIHSLAQGLTMQNPFTMGVLCYNEGIWIRMVKVEGDHLYGTLFL
jgi:hypothetical protein